MAVSKHLNALFYPHTVCLDEVVLKYLLLIYDKIYYLPNDTELNPGHTKISARYSMYDGLLFGAFGTRKDAHYSLMYASEPGSWDDELKRLMDAYDQLEEDDVCVALEDEAFRNPRQQHPLHSAVASDVADPQFRYWCDRFQNPKFLLPKQPGTKSKYGGLMVRPPAYSGDEAFSALCSERVNACLYFAGELDLVPVSNHDLFIRLLGIKLKRIHANPDYRALERDRERKRRARFSTLSWQLLTEVVPPEGLAQRSVPEVLRYKAASRDLSTAFREYLFRLEAGLSSEPWDETLRDEVNKLVRTEVIPEVQRIREKKAQIWQDLFHETLKSTLSLKTLAPLLTPALTMHFFPAVSYWDLIRFSTAIMAGGVLPKLLDARKEESALRRNALFFVFQLGS